MAPQTRVGDLRNEIHAVFRRKNFKNISDFEYDALRPSLQFASLFLTTPELAGFPHAVLVAPYKHVPHPENEELDEWAFQEKGSQLTKRDLAMYNLALTTLADMVVFVASSKTHSKTEDLTIHSGECGRERHICAQNSHLYHGSTILFSREEIDAHTDPGDCYRLYQGDLGIKWRTFISAKILLHELMHAMAYARLGCFKDIPFGSNKVVETGYEWENYVFGGVVCSSNMRWSSLDDDASLMITDWPAASITRGYQHSGWPIEVREEPPTIEIWWWLLPVMNDWFDKLFTTEFWEKIVPEQGVSALRAPRKRGYRVKVAEDGTPTLFEWDSNDAASYGCTIPPGYEEDYDGEVVIAGTAE
jgi:hypothetical protein